MIIAGSHSPGPVEAISPEDIGPAALQGAVRAVLGGRAEQCLDSSEIECHGRYAGECGPIAFVLPDDDDLPDPIEVGADRIFPEKFTAGRGRCSALSSDAA